jgi:hypothetical protein
MKKKIPSIQQEGRQEPKYMGLTGFRLFWVMKYLPDKPSNLP